MMTNKELKSVKYPVIIAIIMMIAGVIAFLLSLREFAIVFFSIGVVDMFILLGLCFYNLYILSKWDHPYPFSLKEEKKLIPLVKWNEQQRKRIKERNTYPKLNGIACPDCGKELYDSNFELLLSNPGQRYVHCSKCEYKGTRIA